MIEDIKFFKDNSPSKSYFAILINPCFYSVILYRVSNKVYRLKIPLIPKLIWIINRIIFNVDIDYRATIGKRFMLVHGMGVVIGCNTVIEENCKLFQGVTLGGNSGKKRVINNAIIEQPIIRKNTIIYANAVVVGPVVIGANSIIGANSFISKDINSNSTVRMKSDLIIKSR